MSLYAFLVVLLLSVPAWAAIFHTAKTGSDGVSCATAQNWTTGTPALAKVTINAGTACLAPGDTLLVHAGTYLENIKNPSFGTSSAYKIIKSVDKDIVTIPRIEFDQSSPVSAYIEFAGFILDCDAGGNDAYGLAGFQGCTSGQCAGWFRLRDMEIKNCGAEGIFAGGISNTTNIELIRLNVHDNGYVQEPPGQPTGPGGYLIGPGILVDGGSWHHNAHDGIQFRLEGSGFSSAIVRNASFHHNGVMGLRFNNFGSQVQAYNNSMYANGDRGLEIAANGLVYSNTITGNTQGGISCRTDSGNWTIDGKNNIIYSTGPAFDQCTLGTIIYQSTVTSDPGFVGSAFGDFRISSPFSPAVTPPGLTLGPPWNTDQQGAVRQVGSYTKGALEFVSVAPPTPGLIALYHADLNANDSIDGFNGTLTNGALANGVPIVSGNSFVFDGSNDYVNVPGNITLRPAAIGMALWMNSLTPPIDEACNVIRMGNAWSMGWLQDGKPYCWVNFGPTAQPVTGTVLTGTNQMLACAYDPSGSGPGVRLWQGTTLVAFTPTSSPLVYSGSENLTIGGNAAGGFNCAGRVDEVQLANFAWSQSDIDAFFLQVTPTTGIAQTRHRYTVANTAEGNWLGAEDTDQSLVVTSPWGQRWALHQGSGTPTLQNFRPYCRINHSPGGWGPWTELTNSFGSFGLRYLTDTAVNVGDPTTPLLTLDGFTGVPGKFFADVVDVVGPVYDASQKIDLATGQHAEQEIRLQAGSPVVAGDLIQCKPRHESGADLSGGYGSGDVNVRTLTMLAVIAPATARVGGTTQGGTFQ